ncbi:competence/damage-inducible protein A [Phosphitispora fastidiosa]|uniref:competence/damage-inducible protein A n=1 Tax=Phosphitispora fastidiosa TaxID=2837202 RepID=UPI001E4ACEA9|nr:competence/damage-inducible protein A [Phosphitispora fastidiosa]MBU7005255.1 nicotinamide-nucleotide amidase [Phosphitispora fastidiosa]
MRAELISTGTELLLGQIVNTNAQFIGQRLAKLGIDVFFQTTVGDNESRLREVVKTAMGRADLIIVTGGLGPTSDDLTRETIAGMLGAELVMDEESLAHIRDFFEIRGRIMPQINAKQALNIHGAVTIPNRIGTAPGSIVEFEGKSIVILPGPPVEMRPMFVETVEDYLRKMTGTDKAVIVSRVLKILGMGESMVEERISDLVDKQVNPTIAFLAPKGEAYIRLTAKANSDDAAGEIISGVEAEIRNRLGDYIYGTDDDTLEGVVAGLLHKHGLTAATAESCTGGLIASRLTEIPGVSENFVCGFITYSNDAKINMLGVSRDTLEKYGAVSEQTALEMAVGARNAGGTDVAVSVTGIAGPGGGTPEKPVGQVYIALAGQDNAFAVKNLFTGDREVIRWQSANVALNILRRYLQHYNSQKG